MTQTTLSRRDEIALRIACGMLMGHFLIKDADDPDKPVMGMKAQCMSAIEIADAMIEKLDGEWDGTERRADTRLPYPECCDD